MLGLDAVVSAVRKLLMKKVYNQSNIVYSYLKGHYTIGVARIFDWGGLTCFITSLTWYWWVYFWSEPGAAAQSAPGLIRLCFRPYLSLLADICRVIIYFTITS